jgi:hypothetical protein
MSYVYGDVDTLPGSPAVGTEQCVALVEYYAKTPAPARTQWSQGDDVKGNRNIKKGMAIATFVNGRYPSRSTGNHAALYVSQALNGIWVVDQYKGSGGIHKRLLRFTGKKPDGRFIDPSNNGDAFSVIE